MPADPRLLALPALRELAEGQARDLYDAHGLGRRLAWVDLATEWRDCEAAAHLALLADLARPASRRSVECLIADKFGVETTQGVHFARYVCGEHCCDGQSGRMVPCDRPIWSLAGDDGFDPITFADCPDPDEWDGDEHVHVPGVAAVTDPAEALTLIALRVLGAR